MKQEQQREPLKLYMPLRAVSFSEENSYGEYEPCDYPDVLTNHELTYIKDELNQLLAEYQEYDTDKKLAEFINNDALKEKVYSYHFEFDEVDGDLWGVAVVELTEPLYEFEVDLLMAEVTGQASDGVGEGFEQQEIKFGKREIYISLWNMETEWCIKTAEEMGINEQDFGMSME